MRLENYLRSDRYRELAEEVIEEHEALHWLKHVRIDYISSIKDKKSKDRDVYGECIKIKEMYQLYVPYDFIIVIYELHTHRMTEKQLKILLYHELLHIGCKEKDGELIYTTNPHDIEDFRTIISKYGMDWAR